MKGIMTHIKNKFKKDPEPNWARRNKMVQCWAILWDDKASAEEQTDALIRLRNYAEEEL